MSTDFITQDDYRTVCDDYEYEQICGLDTQYRRAAESTAIEQIASYTRYRYDMQRAFAAQGSERNPLLVQCAVNIALWLMVHRMPQNMGHERRECLYNDAMQWLRDIQAGRATPDLPTYTADDGTTDANNPVRCGSMPKNRYDW